MQQIWQQLNILNCTEMKSGTIVAVISKPDIDFTQDDVERTKLHLENGVKLMVFKDEKNDGIGFAVRLDVACKDKEFFSRRNLNMAKQSILKQKSSLEWLSWYKSMSIETLKGYSTSCIPSIFKYEGPLPKVYMENSPQKPTNFIHLPMDFVLSKCKPVSESDSVFLVKTSRDAYEDRFRLRKLSKLSGEFSCVMVDCVVHCLVNCVVHCVFTKEIC